MRAAEVAGVSRRRHARVEAVHHLAAHDILDASRERPALVSEVVVEHLRGPRV